MRTVTGLSHQPFAIAADATASALEPEALVSPAPRSQTSAVTSCGPSTRTSWTLVRSGKRPAVSSRGPSRSSSARSDVGAHDRVRVADRDRRQLDVLAVELHRLDLADLGLPDAPSRSSRPRAVAPGSCGRPHADRHSLARPTRSSEPARRDPAAVAGELRHASRPGSRSRSRLLRRRLRSPRGRRRSRCRSGRRRAGRELGVERTVELGPLDEQIAVTERVPFPEPHPPPLPPVDPRRS